MSIPGRSIRSHHVWGELTAHGHVYVTMPCLISAELVHAPVMGARYATALEAMTRSRDLYREAAESAPAALAEATGGEGMPCPPVPEPAGGGRLAAENLHEGVRSLPGAEQALTGLSFRKICGSGSLSQTILR